MRKRFFGDTNIAQAYTKDAANLLATVKHDMSYANLQQGSRQVDLPNGVVLFAASRFGQDEVRIFAPPPVADKSSARENWGKVLVDYTIWLVMEPAYDTFELQEFRVDSTFGRSIPIPEIGTAEIIYAGWLWYTVADYTNLADYVRRYNLYTGVVEHLYTRDMADDGSHNGAITVTPRGVMFAIGRINAQFVLIDDAGSVVYSVNTGDLWVGYQSLSFINDGQHAYLYHRDNSSSLRGVFNIDIATGQFTHTNFTASWFESPDDYRAKNVYPAVIAGKTFELAHLNNSSIPWEPTQIRVRQPSTSKTSTVAGDISSYWPVDPYDPDSGTYSNTLLGAMALTDAGHVVAITERTVAVIDPTTNQITSNYYVDEVLGVPFIVPESYGHNNVGPSVSLIPNSNLVLFWYSFGSVTTPFETGVVLFDPITKKAQKTAMPGTIRGYLIEYKFGNDYDGSRNRPIPTRSAEWEYLAGTNSCVNLQMDGSP